MIALMRVVPLLVFSLSAVSAQDSVLEIWQREQVRGAGRSALRPLVNLQDYVYYSQLYNSDIEAALWGWKAAIDDVKTARSWSDPHVALGHFLRPIETRDGPQQQRFSVAQAIPWPSELDARSRVALAVADAERWRYEERRADVALRVIEAYLDCYYLERAIEITERSMQLVEYVEEVLRMRYRSGEQEHGDLMSVQVELGRMEDQISSLRDGRMPAASLLNALIGRPHDAAVAALDTPMVTQLEIDSLRVWALRDSPHIQMLRAALGQAQGVLELSEKERYPDLTVGLDYVRTGERAAAGSASGRDPLVVMATVKLPVWRDKYRGREDASISRYQAARLALVDGERGLLAELEGALFGRRESMRKMALYGGDLLAKAEQAFSVTQQSFTAGRSGFLELMSAQRTLIEFQLAHEKASVERMRHEARIQRLAGRRMPSRSVIERELLRHDR